MRRSFPTSIRGRRYLLLPAGLMTAAICTLAGHAFGSFGPATNFAVGTAPAGIASGDMNGDGNLDFAVANSASNNVSILLGDGSGGFGAATSFAVGNVPQSVATGDVNGDDNADLAVGNRGSGSVSILLGNGAGSFGAATNFTAGTNPSSVAIGKLDGDAFFDLAVANAGSNNVSILLGNGAGSFGAATPFAVGTNPTSVVVANLNAGSDPDLAVANYDDNNVSILLGNGAGAFGAATNFAVGTNPTSVSAGNLDADSNSDLAVSNDSSNNVSILLGNGAGSFGAATNFTAGSQPYSVAIGSLNGDGKADLAVANYNSNNVSTLIGNGDGTFAAATALSTGSAPRWVTIGDLNGDIHPDLAAANEGTDNVSILLNNGPVATADPPSLTFPDQEPGIQSAAQTVTVSNSAEGYTLLVDQVSANGADAGDFTVGSETCSAAPVPVSGTCQVQVSFTPSALGARSATLSLTYNGNASPLTVPLTGIGIDVTPPDTIIDSGPSGTITTSEATFTFSGSPANDTAKIQCSIDAEPFADCGTQRTFSGLTDGSHTATFRAEDTSGNQDPTPATGTFSVDTTVFQAKISKVTLSGPARVRKSRKATYKVKILNSGNAVATGVRLKVSGRGVSFNTSVGKISAGSARTVKVRLKPKKTGKVKAAFKVTSTNAGGRTARKSITVRK